METVLYASLILPSPSSFVILLFFKTPVENNLSKTADLSDLFKPFPLLEKEQRERKKEKKEKKGNGNLKP